MTQFPTSASLSSAAPVGLFYSMASLSPIGTVVDLATHSREGSPVVGRGRTVNPLPHGPVGATPTPRTNPALADGGQLSARNLLSKVTRPCKAGGVF